MPAALKETAEGGLAATPTGKMLHGRYLGSKTGKAHREILQNVKKLFQKLQKYVILYS